MADLTFPEGAVEFELVITHNVLTGAFGVTGHAKNRLVALGMLEYAKQLIKHENMRQFIIDELKNRPRVVPSGGFPQ